MIQKIIHYCWYGRGEFSPEIKMCIESWEKFCPDYEIKCWNEENTPMNIAWIKEAYKHRKYAFVADYVRFYALYHEGGIYMDTDMLLKKPLDNFLNHSFFTGLQDKYSVALGIIGCKKEHLFNKTCLDYYDSIKFNVVSPPIITHILTKMLAEKGFKEEDKYQELAVAASPLRGLDTAQYQVIALYPTEYFYPIHYTQKFELWEIDKFCTKNTYGVHLWNQSWISELTLLANKEYKKGFRLAFERIKRTPFLPLKYYKKIAKYIVLYLLKK
ncbi:MAG: glycosyl transferase [Prevotellaceae bacterium]|jgi:hypothetical protein|nr:glycosyl transferase [Prevotellaceae bacterium]